MKRSFRLLSRHQHHRRHDEASWSSPHALEVPTEVLGNFLRLMKPNTNHKPAVIDAATRRSITYQHLPAAISAAMQGLRRAGVKEGTVVSIHCSNGAEYILAFHAILNLGAVCTTSNPAYTPMELARQYQHCGAEFAICQPEHYSVVKEAADQSGVKSIFVIGEPSAHFLAPDAHSGFVSYGTGRHHSAIEAVHEVDTDSTAALPYSSGTTGVPKGVMLTHRNLTTNVAQMLHPDCHFGISGSDTMLCVLPLYHIYGMQVCMNTVLSAGGTFITLPKFEPLTFLENIQRYKVTWAPLVPPLVSFLLRHPLAVSNQFDISTLKRMLSAAAPLDGESQAGLAAKLGADVRQGYGMTELSPISHVDPVDRDGRTNPVYGSVGKPVAGTTAMFVDPATGEVIPPGAGGPDRPGELWVKGPQVMKGYLNNPKATEEMLTSDGYCKTGDLGYQREDGYTFVVDRLKELIKVKGLQVAPAELEGVVLQHPAVLDVCVVGKACNRAGEVPVAFVVRKRDALLAGGDAEKARHVPSVSEEELKAFVSTQVAPYKQLSEVRWVEAIPKTPSGKILRRNLRQML